jgi:hypothetical protein
LKPLLLFLIAFLLPATAGQTAATEAEFRDAVQVTEDFARQFRSSLKTYHDHLLSALYRLGYSPFHPLFRTMLDGFSVNQIDLEALDEFKMGRLAFQLRSQGTPLAPDPFVDWAQVQNYLEKYPKTIDPARRIAARADILDAASPSNIPPDVFRKLMSRWRSAIRGASESYDRARAVAAVRFQNGVMVPSEANVRALPDAGAYASACGSGMCSNK